MPRQLPTLAEIQALVPETLWCRTVVAGGYAYRPDLAYDVDIWVLRQFQTEDFEENGLTAIYPSLQEDADQINAHLLGHGDLWRPDEAPAYTELDEEEVLLVKAGHFSSGMRFHLLCAAERSLESLLNRFDLPIHACGWYLQWGPEGTVIRLPEAGHGPLEVNYGHVADPLNTIVRLVRISRRYNRPVNFAAIEVLLRRATAEAQAAVVESPAEDDLVPLTVDDIPF